MRLVLVAWLLVVVGCAARAPALQTSHREIARRWIAGQSLDQIAADLGIDRDDARARVVAALRRVKRQVPEGRLR